MTAVFEGVLRRRDRAPGSRQPASQQMARPLYAVDATQVLDPRVWLVWLAAVTVPALAGRNPFPLLGLLVVVLVVRSAWSPALTRDATWTLVLRLALFAAVISVAFNLVAAPYGNQVIVRLPAWWPLGDVMTFNALLYGLLGALAIVVILLAGTITGALVDWPALLRMVPGRLLPLAVAGSIAWAFVPQTVATIRDIRDAQRSRGLRFGSARTLVPILVPLIGTALERASTTAEALESRGFGGERVPRVGNRAGQISAVLALASSVLGVAAWLDGRPVIATVGVIVAVSSIAGAIAVSRRSSHRTRYRRRRWTGRDVAVLTAALGSLGISGMVWIRHREAIAWSPYPDITVPAGDGMLMLAILVLLTPAVIAPAVVTTDVSVSRLVLDPPLADSESADGAPVTEPVPIGPTGRRFYRRRGRPFACWPPRVRAPRPDGWLTHEIRS